MVACPYYNPTTALAQTNNARGPTPSAHWSGQGRQGCGLVLEQGLQVGQAGCERSSERLHLLLYLVKKKQQAVLDEIPIKGDALITRLPALEL
jgi:hypothetical protein